MFKKITGTIFAFALLTSAFFPTRATVEADTQPPPAADPAAATYQDYLKEHKNTARAGADIAVDLGKAVFDADSGFALKNDYQGLHASGLYTPGEGRVDFPVTVPEDGLYFISIDYIAEYERGSEIQRQLLINESSPYKEASLLEFNRLYQNGEKATDIAGNDIRPTQLEVRDWQSAYLSDSSGYSQEPLLFFFHKGENILTLKSVGEPLSIGGITLAAPYEPPAYAEIQAEYRSKGYRAADCPVIYLQGEDAALKSSPTLYPTNDTTSPQTMPYEKNKTRLNTIGGSRWNSPGQFLTWKFHIEKAGLYTVVTKVRQNVARGILSGRDILIDGKIPFREFQNVQYGYEKKWQQATLGSKEQPYSIYLEAGDHELTMKAVLGDTSLKIQEVENILAELNRIYTTIMIITGSAPDTMRDYSLNLLVPEEIERMGALAEQLNDIVHWFEKHAGEKGQNGAALETAVRLLRKMSGDHEQIPKNFASFKTNIGSLASWIVSVKERPLEVDYIALVSGRDDLPKPNAGFLRQIGFQVRNFISSFYLDYSSMGSQYKSGGRTLDVWITTGRDQAQVVRKLIDSTFVAKTGISVNLKLVNAGVLLPATVSGIGPDAAMNMGDAEPVNYAIRKAACSLSRFEDFPEIKKRFPAERMVPFYLEDECYALPETQGFDVLFYRRDILKQLGIGIPQTWNDVISIIPVLMKNNMSFALPVSTAAAPQTGVSSFMTLLFQRGGELYKNGGTSTAIDSLEGIEAFDTWTNLYKNYELPLSYDFQNRFRTGEYPLIISSFGSFNSLTVSAPEIKGLWSFAPIPGTEKADGTIDRSSSLSGTCVVIMQSSDQKKEAWEYLKWWTDADVQVEFGKEMESILGASARYATANVEAMKRIPWSKEHYDVLTEQMKWVRGVEQVPGGYFTNRHLDNAFRKIVNNDADPKETLSDYAYIINKELTNKRKEFGMSTAS